MFQFFKSVMPSCTNINKNKRIFDINVSCVPDFLIRYCGKTKI